MIVVSLLLIGAAVVMLVLGLSQPSSVLLTASIGASVLAAVVLVIGARRTAAMRASESVDDDAEPPYEDDGQPRHDDDPEPPREHDPEPPDEQVAEAAQTGRFPTQYLSYEQLHRRPYRQDADPLGQQVAVAAPVAQQDGTGVSIPQQPAGAASDALATAPAQSGYAAGAEQPAQYPDDEDPPDEPAPQLVSAADAARVGQMGTEVLVVDGRPRYHLSGCVHLLGRESEPLPVSEAIELGFTPCSLCEPDSALLAEARRV